MSSTSSSSSSFPLSSPPPPPPPPPLSPPLTPTQATVVSLSSPTRSSSSSSSSSSSVPPPFLPSLPLPLSLCSLTVPQLLSLSSSLTHSLPQPSSPHPLLVCNYCGLPVARHSQLPQSPSQPSPRSSQATAQQRPYIGHGTPHLPSTHPLYEEDSDSGSVGGGGVGVGDGKLLNDPIHGYIHLDAALVALLDTPHFQRLRDLKQLGTCYLVFPGASHNRFEHSIGVCHLADCLLSHLSQLQPELGISLKEKFLVKLAGLSHDLGHGPFSHVFDSEFIPRALQSSSSSSPSPPPSSPPTVRWHHEVASVMMLKDALVCAGLELSASDLSFVCELIDPTTYPPRSSSKPFLYEVVANARTSLDVDKFDYLARDCHNIGMSTNLKHDRLIKNCRVIDGHLCFNSKEVYNLYELFHTRYSLFKQVYSHRVSKAIEYMITDVLLSADPHLHISQSIHSPQRYLTLTDCILKQIEVSTDAELEEARALILRIRTRKLYRLVEEAIIPISMSDMADVTAEDLLLFSSSPPSPSPQSLVQPHEVVVENLRLHYATKEKNPVDSIRFFDKANVNSSYAIPKQKVSHVMPEHFQERLLRVYIKDIEELDERKPKFHSVKAAAIAWLKAHDCVSPVINRTASGALLSRGQSFLRSLQEREERERGDKGRGEVANGVGEAPTVRGSPLL